MKITLRNHSGIVLQFSSTGATWLSCQLPLQDHTTREILLPCFNPQQNSDAYIGATIGRYSNRIKNATLEYNNVQHNLAANQGSHQLHGGAQGWHTLPWQIITQQTNRVIFGLISADNDQGFPGEVKATVDFMLTEQNEVIINYIATTNKSTPINLTNHAYFNLNGAGDIKEHQLSVDADYYLPVTKDGLPVHNIKTVSEGDMDLRTLQKLSHHFWRSEERKLLQGYDHAYLLNEKARRLTRPAARLISADQKIEMQVLTNKPAIQIYTGNNLQGIKRSENSIYQNYSGIALETEFLPDSPNHPDWPHENCWFTANDFYCYTTIYRFIV